MNRHKIIQIILILMTFIIFANWPRTAIAQEKSSIPITGQEYNAKTDMSSRGKKQEFSAMPNERNLRFLARESLASEEEVNALSGTSGTKAIPKASPTELISPLQLLLMSEQESKSTVVKQLDVPLISQYPQLPSGCEVTALAMALQYYGINVSKTTLASQMSYDHTAKKRNENGKIIQWGDPEIGYLGDPYSVGNTINPNPLKKLLDKYRSGGIALYGKDFSEIEEYINEGKPTIVWFTLNYQIPKQRTWKTPSGRTIYAPTPLHSIVITGVDEQYVYFNDSDAAKKNVKIPRFHFIKVYNAMGQRALVVS